MRLRFATESGSIYEIDEEARTWKRLRRTTGAAAYPHEASGSFLRVHGVMVGERVHFEYAKGSERMEIVTSPVASVARI